MEILFAPWRYRYVSTGDNDAECVFCKIINDDKDDTNLVLRRAGHNLIVLNRFPYTSGHLMIVPFRHLSDPCQAAPEELAEMMSLTTVSLEILRKYYKPHGFNLGMNLGRVAGAGVEHHFHFHVIPRWSGDTSFVSVVGEARVIPESLEDTFLRLRDDFIKK